MDKPDFVSDKKYFVWADGQGNRIHFLCVSFEFKEEEIETFQIQRSKNFASQFIKGENVADSLLKTFNKMYVARGDFNLFLKICIVIPRKWF